MAMKLTQLHISHQSVRVIIIAENFSNNISLVSDIFTFKIFKIDNKLGLG